MFSSFGKRSMDRLEKNIGEEVKIDLVFYRTPLSIMGKLKNVERFRFIKVEDVNIVKPTDFPLSSIAEAGSAILQFVWPGYAIKTIKNSEVLYNMCYIEDSYSLTNPTEVLKLAEIIYGKKVADNFTELKQMVAEKERKSAFRVSYN